MISKPLRNWAFVGNKTKIKLPLNLYNASLVIE